MNDTEPYLFIGGTLDNKHKYLGHPVRLVENHTMDGIETYRKHVIYDNGIIIFYALDEFNDDHAMYLYKELNT